MNSFQTKIQPSLPKQKKPKKKSSRDYDELCDTPDCNHMLRNHVAGSQHGAVCGVYPCPCLVFTPSRRFYNWAIEESCQKCQGKVAKKGDVLCPPCGRSFSNSLDIDPNL